MKPPDIPGVKPRGTGACTFAEVIEMTKNGTRALLLLLVALVALSAVAAADGGAAPLGIIPTPTPTPNPLTVNIWTNKTGYVVGEYVTIYYSVSQPAYVYIYDIQPDGLVRLILPNAYEQANYASAGTHTLPGSGAYRFTVTPPTGTEQLQIFASPVPLALSPSSYSEAFPMVGSNPHSAGVAIKGIIPTDPQQAQWVTAWTSVTISQSYGYTYPGGTYPYPYPYPTPTPTPTPGPGSYPPMYPPFPGTPGGMWYWYNGSWQQGMPTSGWYFYFSPQCSCWRITFVFSWHSGSGG